ncbi:MULTISPECIES: TadE/TadG family type IV pilus assembly protein [unclassified Mesorhizobium]|uniref:TadE/TadG family type IV pilus assembly protein n=1 Tax=unclassified Mesorhizobium TaxID=325217 RepID=UPI000BB0716D|nr:MULTISPECIES: TadE/TadG family type IV pilus assembly protein [unclassified Mesorhizobium]TGT54165.1 pilus assembly protein [Mesorhizobium sp. M00.F.Ca.ET.170.01.1.1]AZO09874.1 pilus assembly protein [Mesorhizobium sp. M3A.F.Ca.ET.080.04.2.1]PBB86347.1 pilus assembly protein TadE [Mesorhizobium sp. WSM3876]RWE24452.1 MAG: pilus assembly protein [Mesorhizobium sp.]RWE29948.1 MAG: pilus assembly protein [Mesorhizobium sp.]
MGEDPTPGHGRNGTTQAKRRPGFFSDRRGSTAMEFAMLAIPFALLVFAILESCISFAGQEVMANATDDVARQLRTGQIKKADVTETSIKQLICSKLEIMVAKNCPGLLVDLREYASFADAATAGFKIENGDIVLTQGASSTSFSVSPGLAESKNMLRVFYKWPVMTDFMARSMANLKDGNTLLFASVTWQNEPFDD